jgi:putative selenium metabolism protein SsnA
VTLVLSGGDVVTTLDPPSLTRADVVIDDGRIRAIGMSPPDRGERIDATGCIVIPGNVCAHHHLYSELARGMPYRLDPPRNFLQILQRVWWRLDRALDAEGVSLSARSGGADALLAGTTTVFDHHASPNAIEDSLESVASAAEELGLRSVLCYEVTDRDGPERAAAGIEEHRRFGTTPRPLARTMVGAHASFTLSDDSLAACVALADELDTGIHIHVAEDIADELDSGKRFGRRVVERLADAGALSGRSLLAHCVHVDEREATLIHEAGAWVAHNVRSNMANRVGRAPVAGLGTRLVLGTDGVDGDMFAEARSAYFRAREADASVGPEWALSRMAASARLAGAVFGEPLLGRIEQGAPADVVVMAYDPPTPMTNENLAGHFVYGMRGAHVRDVLVNGEIVVREGHLAKVVEAELRARCREYAERLWRRLDGVEAHPFVPQGVA